MPPIGGFFRVCPIQGCSLTRLLPMALSTVSFDTVSIVEDTASATDLLTKNTLTTAGVVVAAGTGVAGAAVLTAALPAQMLLAAGISSGLIYAVDRKSKDLPILPWVKTQEATTSTPAAA